MNLQRSFIILAVPYIYTAKIKGGSCSGVGEEARWITIFSYTSIALNSLIPFGLLGVMNYLIIR